MSGLTILDGGMGRELQNRNLVVNGTIWSARALIEKPEIVTDVHKLFINAGAQVITTSNYSAVPSLLAIETVEDQFEALVKTAGVCARQARDAQKSTVLIAGSLPPLHHSYRPEEVGPEEENVVVYEKIANQLAPYVDLFLCETMSTGLEARAAARAGKKIGKPVWVAWTLDDKQPGHLRSGETIESAYRLLDGLSVDAFLFNCCSPESISFGLPQLRSLTDKPIGGFANAFKERIDGTTRHADRDDLSASRYGEFAQTWIRAGASIVGGCCGIGPDHIRWLKQHLT